MSSPAPRGEGRRRPEKNLETRRNFRKRSLADGSSGMRVTEVPSLEPTNPAKPAVKKTLLSLAFLPLASGTAFGAAGTYDELLWVTTQTPFSYGTSTFYEIDSDTSNLFGAAEFHGVNLGSFSVGDSLYLTAEQKSFKNSGTDVTSHTLFWSVTGTGGSGSGNLNLGFEANLGGGGDQRWGADDYGGLTSNVLNGLGAGSYTLSVWSRITTNGTDAPTEIFNNRGGANYNATFTVVPEPSVALLGGLGILGILRRRR